MPCVFCDSSGPMSREHVLPRWLLKVFPDSPGGDYVRRTVSHEVQEEHSRPGPSFDLVVKDVCRACNNGWMHEMEQAAEPILTPMLLDRATVLTATEQHTVATWAMKTMLTMQGLNLVTERYVSPERYRWFALHRTPLSASHVWLCRYTDRTHWPMSVHQMGMTVNAPGRPVPQRSDPMNGFGVVFAIGPLAFWLFGYDIPEGAMTDGESSDAHVLIWPAFGPNVRWPPPRSIAREEHLRHLAATVPKDTVLPERPGSTR